MFQKARIRLTAWYLVIIMLISITFSIVIYRVLTAEFNRVLRMQQLRREGLLPDVTIPSLSAEPARGLIRPPDPDVIGEAKNRLIFFLGIINLSVLGLSGVAGYFLAGKTLKPIREMIDEQNRFITDASHELRTPISALKVETEVALRSKNINLKDAKHQLNSNLEEINKLQVISDGLIKLTSYQKTNNNLKFINSSILGIAENAVKKVGPLAKQKGVTIKNGIKNTSAEVEKNSFMELFTILLDNAVKYNPKGTIVTLSAKKLDGYIEIRVTDDGIGIKDEDIEHLFNRFYRVDKSRTKNKTNGYGLGLAIAKEIIEKHKGSIRVESSIGKGTIFIVEVPVKH